MTVPPAFAGVNWGQYGSWPTVNIGGFEYRQIPGQGVDGNGRPYYVFDPNTNKILANGDIAADGAKSRQPKQPGTGQQIAAVGTSIVGVAGGAYVANKAVNGWGGGTTPQPTGTPGIVQQPAAQTAPAVAPQTTQVAAAQPGIVKPATPQVVGQPQTIQLPNGSTSTPNGEVLQQDGSVIDPQTGASVGRWVQGAAGIALVYDGYHNFQSGNKVGGALEAGYGASLIGSAANSSYAATAAPYLGLGYGAYELGNMAYNSGDLHKSDTGSSAAQGAVAGAAIGSFFSPVGTAIGAVAGGIFGAALGLTASSKDKYQVIRDKWRENVIKQGTPFMTADYKGSLADGTQIDWNNINGDQGKGTAHMHFEDPVVAKAVAYANVLATAQGATGKAREAIAGEMAKAAIANANGNLAVVQQNMQHFAQQMGMDPATIQSRIQEISQSETKHSSPEEVSMYQVISNDAGELFNSQMQNAPGTPAMGGTTQATPTKQSNGQYRLSPGVYSNSPTGGNVQVIGPKVPPGTTTFPRPGLVMANKPLAVTRRK